MFIKGLPTSAGAIISGGTTIIGGTAGSVLFVGSGGVVQEDNANFFWDDTNNRLGLGVNSSIDARLHIVQAAQDEGAPPYILHLAGGAHTDLNNAEVTDVFIDLARTVNLDGGAGAISTYRAFRVTAPTISADAAQTITDAYAFRVDGPPVASTNVTLTNTWAGGFAGNVDLRGAATNGSPLFIATRDTTSAGAQMMLGIDFNLGPFAQSHTDGAGNSTINAAAVRMAFGGNGFIASTSPATAVGAARTFTNRIQANTTGLGFNAQTPIARPDYTITNPTTNRSIDVSAITLGLLAQVVGTMIQDFIDYGLYQ